MPQDALQGLSATLAVNYHSSLENNLEQMQLL
jgi:hypothetical protein